ncbi:hypothetical protein [Roseococcus sp.]|uniref:hypothetical protein n=1 Tax=Roseococcus sp. TaxID=2109646 RepID=UPI003BAA1A32
MQDNPPPASTSPVNVLRTARPEEGTSEGEVWAVLRALGLVVLAVIVLGYIFG